jgi:predicted Holliday junction resolvase-like endonuclease
VTALILCGVVLLVLVVVFAAARRTAKTAFDSEAEKISERIKQHAETKQKQQDEETAKKLKEVASLSGDELRRRAISRLVRGGKNDSGSN